MAYKSPRDLQTMNVAVIAGTALIDVAAASNGGWKCMGVDRLHVVRVLSELATGAAICGWTWLR